MREATVEEREGLYEYIKSISIKLVLTFLIIFNYIGIIIVLNGNYYATFW